MRFQTTTWAQRVKKKCPTSTEVGPQAALITPPPLLVGEILIGKSYAGNSYFSGAINIGMNGQTMMLNVT